MFENPEELPKSASKSPVLGLENPQSGPWRVDSEGSQVVEMRRFKILDGFLGIQNGRFGSEKRAFRTF